MSATEGSQLAGRVGRGSSDAASTRPQRIPQAPRPAHPLSQDHSPSHTLFYLLSRTPAARLVLGDTGHAAGSGSEGTDAREQAASETDSGTPRQSKVAYSLMRAMAQLGFILLCVCWWLWSEARTGAQQLWAESEGPDASELALFDLLPVYAQFCEPAVATAWRLCWPLALIILTPWAKDQARALDGRVCSRRCARMARASKACDSIHQLPIVRYVILALAVAAFALRSGPLTRLLATKGAVIAVWLIEIWMRREAEGVALVTTIISVASVALHLFWKARRAAAWLPAEWVSRIVSWQLALGWSTSAAALEEASRETSLGTAADPLWATWISMVNAPFYALGATWTLGLVLLAIASTLVERALAAHLERSRPAHRRLTLISLESRILWTLLTILHIILHWMIQPTSLASIFIIWQQKVRYNQERTFWPTLIFFLIEAGTIFMEQLMLRAAEARINGRRVLRGSDPAHPEEAREVARQLLRVGDCVILQPGDEVPGTMIPLGALTRWNPDDVGQGGVGAVSGKSSESPCGLATREPADSASGAGERITFVINTVSIDGETAGKERSFVGWPPRISAVEGGARGAAVAAALESADFETLALELAAVYGLATHGGAGPATGDAELSKEPSVVRQGARIGLTAPYPVWGLLIGFNGASSASAEPGEKGDVDTLQVGALEAFLSKVSAVHVAILIVYTMCSVFVAWSAFGRTVDMDLVVELLLANNVALTMTLSAIMGSVVWLLHREFSTEGAVDSLSTAGKHALIAFTEGMARAQSKQSARRIVGIHMTDKTGTITRNKMKLCGSVPICGCLPGGELTLPPAAKETPGGFEVVAVDDDERNAAVVALHIAVTSNTPRAPNLEPEEQAYSVGLGVAIERVDTDPDTGWETLQYTHGGRRRSLRRLFFPLSRARRCVAALVNAADLGCGDAGEFRLVVQGSVEMAAGQTGLRVPAGVKLPSLDTTSDLVGRPAGAQRNWVLAVSKGLLRDISGAGAAGTASSGSAHAVNSAELQALARELRRTTPDASAVATLDKFLASMDIVPVRLMVLVDLYRDGVQHVPQFLASKRCSFWMVTGDARGNARAIAQALGMYDREVAVDAGDEQEFPVQLRSALEGAALNGPCTLYLSARQQRWLKRMCRTVNTRRSRHPTPASKASLRTYERIRELMCAVSSADDVHAGVPMVQCVCYESEVDLKGDLVNFGETFLDVPVAFTGDGMNDIAALQRASLSFAFPNDSGDSIVESELVGEAARDSPPGQALHPALKPRVRLNHNLEVAAAAPIRVGHTFWMEYISGDLHRWSSLLWAQAVNVVYLLVLKQSGTAGINIASAASSGFTQNGDPYEPRVYFVCNALAFALIILAGGFVLRRRPIEDVAAGAQLRWQPVALASGLSYLTGVLALSFSSFILSCMADYGWVTYDGNAAPLTARTSVALVILLSAIVGVAVWRATRKPADRRSPRHAHAA